MSFSGLFQTQGMLFLLLLIGYIFGKKGLADGTGKNLLTDLVIYVTLPGSIIKSFQIEFNHQILIACMTIAIAGIVIQTGSSVLECFFIITMETAKRKCAVCHHLFQCGNSGKSYRGRDFRTDGNDVCVHLCDPTAYFYVVCRSYLFYRGTG